MQQRRHLWACCLAVAAAVTLVPLIGPVSAQAPGQEVGAVSQPGNLTDEMAPRLVAGPNGTVFRLWIRRGDLQKGGGGLFLSLASPNDTWQKSLEIVPSQPGVSTLDPAIAFGPSKEVAVAYQWRQHNPRAKEIRLALSDDGGKTWTQPPTGIEGSGKGFVPKLAWGRDRTLVVAWADERRQGRTWDVYARRSGDGGKTWEPEQLLSRFPQQTTADVYIHPVVLSDGQDRFWAVWMGLRNGQSKYYLSRSVNGGQTWADPVALTGDSQSVFGHRLVRSGDRLLLVWQDSRTGLDRIYSVSSGDGGVTWTSPTRVDHLPAESRSDASSPAAVLGADGEAFVAWQDGRNGRPDIFIGRSGDGGRSWDKEDTRLDMDDAGTAFSKSPAVARAADGRLAVAWEDDRAGYEGIYLRVRSAGPSAAWGPETLVSTPASKKAARVPTVLWGSGGALHVAWEVWDYTRGPMMFTIQVDGRTVFPDKK